MGDRTTSRGLAQPLPFAGEAGAVQQSFSARHFRDER